MSRRVCGQSIRRPRLRRAIGAISRCAKSGRTGSTPRSAFCVVERREWFGRGQMGKDAGDLVSGRLRYSSIASGASSTRSGSGARRCRPSCTGKRVFRLRAADATAIAYCDSPTARSRPWPRGALTERVDRDRAEHQDRRSDARRRATRSLRRDRRRRCASRALDRECRFTRPCPGVAFARKRRAPA